MGEAAIKYDLSPEEVGGTTTPVEEILILGNSSLYFVDEAAGALGTGTWNGVYSESSDVLFAEGNLYADFGHTDFFQRNSHEKKPSQLQTRFTRREKTFLLFLLISCIAVLISSITLHILVSNSVDRSSLVFSTLRIHDAIDVGHFGNETDCLISSAGVFQADDMFNGEMRIGQVRLQLQSNSPIAVFELDRIDFGTEQPFNVSSCSSCGLCSESSESISPFHQFLRRLLSQDRVELEFCLPQNTSVVLETAISSLEVLGEFGDCQTLEFTGFNHQLATLELSNIETTNEAFTASLSASNPTLFSISIQAVQNRTLYDKNLAPIGRINMPSYHLDRNETRTIAVTGILNTPVESLYLTKEAAAAAAVTN